MIEKNSALEQWMVWPVLRLVLRSYLSVVGSHKLCAGRRGRESWDWVLNYFKGVPPLDPPCLPAEATSVAQSEGWVILGPLQVGQKVASWLRLSGHDVVSVIEEMCSASLFKVEGYDC